MLAGRDVDYRLVRARRRSIGMQIGLSGLTVRAPRWVSIREIEAALTERAAWIVRSLAEWRARRRDVLPREWKTGAPIVYRGRELALAVHPARQPAIAPTSSTSRCCIRRRDDERQVAAFVARWLREEALRGCWPRAWPSSRRGSRPRAPPVKLSNARSEWGSCNAARA